MEAIQIALRAVGILSGLTGLLAIGLVIAQKYLANFGACKLHINKERELTVQGGGHLLDSLLENKIFIPSACGGRGTCGYCKVKVQSGGGPVLTTEAPFLSDEERAQGVRLSCCVRVRNDLEIELPPEILALREYTTRVGHLSELTYNIKELRLALVEPDTITFRAGQYVQFKIPAYGKSLEPTYRAYSIASPSSESKTLEFVIQLVPGGICTTYVFEYLKEGDVLMVNGPYGEFALCDTDAEIIFVAGATGIAPIKSMLQIMAEENSQRKATFYFGAVQKRDLFYLDIMREFEKRLPKFTFIPALSQKAPEDQWDGEEGLITEVVDRHVGKGSQAEAYLCGSPGMIDACIKALRGKDIPQERIFFDKFE